METLTIKSPDDMLSFIGHALGFWPKESLVCITLDTDLIGATLRVDLPRHDGTEVAFARTVAGYLAADTSATSVLFALYSSTPWEPGQAKPHAKTIAALTGALAERGIPIREGLLVGDHEFCRYDSDPGGMLRVPISATQSSTINAEFVYRGSVIAPTDRVTLPVSSQDLAKTNAVERRMEMIRNLSHTEAIAQARSLWTGLLEAQRYPTEEEVTRLIANFQFVTIRDHLMADIPGIDEPMEQVLFAQTHGAPKWSRVEWAQQLLIHAYTKTSNEHAAPLLTAIGYINWWEGRGSKAHQFLQLALEADPEYRLARLSDQMVGYGMVAGWNMDKDRAYRSRGLGTP